MWFHEIWQHISLLFQQLTCLDVHMVGEADETPRRLEVVGYCLVQLLAWPADLPGAPAYCHAYFAHVAAPRLLHFDGFLRLLHLGY